MASNNLIIFLLNDSTENKSQFGANTFWEFL